jgi:hypothetical protein
MAQGPESIGVQRPYVRMGTLWLHYPLLFDDLDHSDMK